MTNPRQISQGELIALLAMMSGTIAFSIDSMLPALPQIADELTADIPNRAQLILTSFVLGLGIGTLFVGALSDAFGRKPVAVGGAVLYCLAALVAWRAPTLEIMLAARVVQGLGAAGPRIVSLALVRDLYSGRDMARITSFVMIVFTLVPALAPLIGQGIIALFGWRQVFLAFLLFSGVSMAWLMLRQPETLPPERRRPLRFHSMWAALREMASIRTVVLSIAVQTLCFGMLFAMLSSVHSLFDQTYGRGATFPLWFGGIAVVASTASMLNAWLVGRLGMRALIKAMLSVQMVLAPVMIGVTFLDLPTEITFVFFVIWTTSIFFQVGLTVGNLNALAMEPVGHIAGMAASIIAAIATVGGAAIAMPIGLAYDGTPFPIAVGVFVCAVLAFFLTAQIRRD